MARRQVGARTEGDVYQGMFFWLKAADILNPKSNISRVMIEYDEATGVDDIAVEYNTAAQAKIEMDLSAEYFQVKYHVDRSKRYGHAQLIDPNFANSKKSILKKFFDCYKQLGSDRWYVLHLVSNWNIDQDDPLLPYLRDSNFGSLPEVMLDPDKARKKKAVFRVRQSWQEHLGARDLEFKDFLSRLRLQLDHFGRANFEDYVKKTLAANNLIIPAGLQANNPYDSLVQKMLMGDLPNQYNRASLEELLRREGLLPKVGVTRLPRLGIRSFERHAEKMNDECDHLLCLLDKFEGRHILDDEMWNKDIVPAVRSFFLGKNLRQEDHAIALDCHLSIAFLAGYELDRKSGAQIYPIQKGPVTTLWKPSDSQVSFEQLWKIESEEDLSRGSDLALSMAVSNDISHFVQDYISRTPLTIGRQLHLRPLSGPGYSSIKGADHAVALANKVCECIQQHRISPLAKTHLFLACPNALAFFIGQFRQALGPLQLYEFDFDHLRSSSYHPSISLL